MQVWSHVVGKFNDRQALGTRDIIAETQEVFILRVSCVECDDRFNRMESCTPSISWVTTNGKHSDSGVTGIMRTNLPWIIHWARILVHFPFFVVVKLNVGIFLTSLCILSKIWKVWARAARDRCRGKAEGSYVCWDQVRVKYFSLCSLLSYLRLFIGQTG